VVPGGAASLGTTERLLATLLLFAFDGELATISIDFGSFSFFFFSLAFFFDSASCFFFFSAGVSFSFLD
jgi:hypothetical protein